MGASLLYIGFLALATGGGLFLTRVGTTSGHLMASAAGAFGCVLAVAAATLALGFSVLGSV